MYQDIQLMLADFRNTYSKFARYLGRSSTKAPSFLFDWTKYLVAKLFSIGTFTVFAVAVIAALEFFGILAASLFVGGQILPALACLIPIAVGLAACVPLFNQFLRIIGVADRARTQKEAGKTMQFFGEAKIPKRYTLEEKNARANEVDNPQLQAVISPPSGLWPKWLSWLSISYLIAPSDFLAAPEYIRYAGNWLMWKSGLEAYAASLDSAKARGDLKELTEFNSSASPLRNRFFDVANAKAQAAEFTAITALHNSKMGSFVRQFVVTRHPEFAIYHAFLKNNPVNAIYRKWHAKNVAPYELALKKANTNLITLQQEIIRLEEIKNWPLTKIVLNPVTYYQARKARAGISIQAIQQAILEQSTASNRYQLALIEAKALNSELQTVTNALQEADNAPKKPIAQIVSEARIAAKQQADAKLEQVKSKLAKIENLLLTNPELADKLQSAREESQQNVATAQQELDMITNHTTFIEEFESAYTQYKLQHAEDLQAAADTPKNLPFVLMLDKTIGVFVDDSPQVLTEEEAAPKIKLQQKVVTQQAEIKQLNEKLASITAIVTQNRESHQEAIARLDELYFTHDLVLDLEQKAAILAQIKADPDYAIYTGIQNNEQELRDLKIKIEEKTMELSRDITNLQAGAQQTNDLQAAASIAESKINSYAGQHVTEKEKNVYEEAYKKAIAVKATALTDDVKVKAAAVENLQKTLQEDPAAEEAYKQAILELEQSKQALIAAYEELPVEFYRILTAAKKTIQEELLPTEPESPEPVEVTAEHVEVFAEALDDLAKARHKLEEYKERLPPQLYKTLAKQLKEVANENANKAATMPEQRQLTAIQKEYIIDTDFNQAKSRILGWLHTLRSSSPARFQSLADSIVQAITPTFTSDQSSSPDEQQDATRRSSQQRQVMW